MKVAVLTLVALAAPCLAGCASFGLGGEAAPGKPSGASTASTAARGLDAESAAYRSRRFGPGATAAAGTCLLPPPRRRRCRLPRQPIPSGAALGGVLGGPIGASLTEADRQAAWNAQIAALDSGQSRSWRGVQGVFGFVAPGAETGGGCRAYSQTIYVGGRPNRGGGVACKQPDGTWR